MLPRIIAMLAALAFLNAPAAPAQTKEHSPDDLLARLSYNSTYVWDVSDDRSPQICFALYRDGYFRISRRSRQAQDGTVSLQGTLPPDQLTRFRTLLKNLDSQTGVGTIYKASESLTAEVMRDGKIVHFLWIDPDHERPFPDSVARVVNWLQDFAPQGSSPLTLRELSDQPICPSASEKPLHPVVASVEGMPEDTLCVTEGANR
ncbi:MAG: hypothetical protein ABSF72_05545 [Candidatus Sulfotelmatobacter sp.]|jgi:hypothetical protein